MTQTAVEQSGASHYRRLNQVPEATRVFIAEPPPPPQNLLPVVRLFWDNFWESPLADYIHKTDLPALYRLFHLYNENELTHEAMHKEPPPRPEQGQDETHNDYLSRLADWNHARKSMGRLIPGTSGLKLNPLLKYIDGMQADILALEDRFGLTLRARQMLGLNQIRAKTLMEQNQADVKALEEFDDDEDPVDALS
jgi:hypothetical protein